jgi:hypothetical protein
MHTQPHAHRDWLCLTFCHAPDVFLQSLPSAKGLPSSISFQFKADSEGEAQRWEGELKKAISGAMHEFSKAIVHRAAQASVCNAELPVNRRISTGTAHSHQGSVSSDSGNASDVSMSDGEVKYGAIFLGVSIFQSVCLTGDLLSCMCCFFVPGKCCRTQGES